MARSELEAALADGSSPARIRQLLAAELERSQAELEKPRAGYEEPVTVAVAPGLVVVAPAPASVRADPEGDRIAALVLAALDDVVESPLEAGEHGGHLAFSATGDPELFALAFDEMIAGVDRLRAAALLVPDLPVTDLRPLVRRTLAAGVPSPHEDPDPVRRLARRMLLTLRGKGKWGGYHTEFTNLARGFKEWELAERVGEAMVDAGLLTQKPSVGQRHVALNPRRKADIDRLIDDAVVPGGLTLPFK